MGGKKLVQGWGVNDTDLPTKYYIMVDGVRKEKKCDYYMDWVRMIQACHSTLYQNNYPTYKGCTVHEEWKYFSKFIEWVDTQPNKDWKNCNLDKDFLIKGNKHYSPDTCVYIPQSLNKFLTNSAKTRGKHLIGVTFIGYYITKPYVAGCQDPFIGKQKHLGYHQTELEAHKAWQAYKHQMACKLAELQDDPRVAKALRERYAPDKDWTKA